MKRRRLLITGVLLLLGGAIVNVAVAWGCLLTVNPLLWATHHTSARQHQAIWIRTVDVSQGSGTVVAHSRFRALEESGLYMEGPPLPQLTNQFSFRSEDKLLSLGGGGIITETYVGAGWPYVALCSLSVEGIQTVAQTQWGIRVTNERWFMGVTGGAPSIPKVLPLRPVWPGFAINTIYYAAMLWVVFFVPGMVRRTIRRRRGLCPACAYPTGGGTSPVCTECGTPFKSTA